MSNKPNNNRTSDRRATLTHDFITGHEYEVVVRAIGPDGTEQPVESAPRAVIKIQGKLDDPSAPTGLVASGYLNAITLIWANPADYDVRDVEIWRSTTNAIGNASKIAEVKGITYIDAIGSGNVTRYYWVRAINTSGLESDYSDVASGTSLGVTATDIDDFAVTATKIFTNTVILSADTWTNNSPGAGSVAWNAHFLTHGGKYYEVTAGNTAARYITWTVGNIGGQGTVADPYLTTYSGDAAWTAVDNKFNLYINEGGVAQAVWNSSANMVIGSAFILDLAVTNAKIADATITSAKVHDLSADKLTAGTIDATVITVSNLTVGTNVAIGTAEDAAGVTTIVGNTITTGYVDALEITVVGAVTAGSLTGLTVQTAATGQRIVMAGGAAGRISLFTGVGEGTEVLIIDDNILFNRPGIKITGGTFYVYDTTYGNAYLEGGTLSCFTKSDWYSIYCQAKNATSHPILALDYDNVGFTGDFVKFRDNAGVTRFEIDKWGNINTTGIFQMDSITIIDSSKNLTNIGTISCGSITTSGTVDGVDIAARDHAESHAFTSHTGETIDPTPTDFDVIYAASGGWTSGSKSVANIAAASDLHAEAHALLGGHSVDGAPNDGEYLRYDAAEGGLYWSA